MRCVSDRDHVDAIKKILIAKARIKHKRIFPCSGKVKLRDCFTIEDNRILFWFNTKDQNTHVMSRSLPSTDSPRRM